MKRRILALKQQERTDCGATCLRMIINYYGKNVSYEKIIQKCNIGKNGASLLNISEAAESFGLRTSGVKLTVKQLKNQVSNPCILHWGNTHYVVYNPRKRKSSKTFDIINPTSGEITLGEVDFKKHFISERSEKGEFGIALLIETTPSFLDGVENDSKKIGWRFLLKYLYNNKSYIFQLLLALGLGSFIQILFPFITQSIVDIGIQSKNLSFLSLVLIGQLVLLLSRSFVEFVRSRILLFISTRINRSILSDFWIKLMRLPISYYESRNTGDIMQRIHDHKRIESFLTGASLSLIFQIFTFIAFSITLLYYNRLIYFIVIAVAFLYFIWIKIFLRYRKKLNYLRFEISSNENSSTVELIQGMQDIKLNGAENLRRWEWERLQNQMFYCNYKMLSLSQLQNTGSLILNEGKNIVITFIVAKQVIDGQLTLGALLAIQYIIGQLNSPIEQLVSFSQQIQDAKISLDRLNEIHQMRNEEDSQKNYSSLPIIPQTISLSEITFSYHSSNIPVLSNITLSIPAGKTIAIVGVSGSGKTTLIKLLLKYYEDYKGELKIGTSLLKDVSPKDWRKRCGIVMQDSYIFSDTIATNISLSDEITNPQQLEVACRLSNLSEFLHTLPLGLETKIGSGGKGISSGQKQRILIARAIYKNPDYIFLDEATNSLDSSNENEILGNLKEYFKNKTLVIVAHRLSTVKDADNIIVLKNGKIIEQGAHQSLLENNGEYSSLIKNQLELS